MQRNKWLRLLAITGVFALMAGAAFYLLKSPDTEPEMETDRSVPALPTLAVDGLATPVRDQILAAHAEAQAAPLDAAKTTRLCLILHAYKMTATAIECYQRARLLDPDAYPLAYYLGIAELQSGNDAGALVQLRDTLALNPDYQPAQLRLAELLMKSGRLQEARELFTALLPSSPHAAWAHHGLGQIYAGLDDQDASITHYLEAVRLFEGFGPAYYALALAYRDRGEAQQAQHYLALYEKYRKQTPPHTDPLMQQLQQHNVSARASIAEARRLFERGDHRGAVQALEEAVSIDPASVEAHTKLIRLYRILKDYDRVEQHYQAAIALDPAVPEAHLQYGQSLGDAGRFTEAADVFAQVLQQDSTHVEARTWLAQAYEELGRHAEAMQYYREAVARQPEDRWLNFLLGRHLVTQGSTEEGMSYLEKATDGRDAQSVYHLYQTALALDAVAQREQAVDWLQRARELAVHSSSPLLGDIMKTQDNWQGAGQQ